MLPKAHFFHAALTLLAPTLLLPGLSCHSTLPTSVTMSDHLPMENFWEGEGWTGEPRPFNGSQPLAGGAANEYVFFNTSANDLHRSSTAAHWVFRPKPHRICPQLPARIPRLSQICHHTCSTSNRQLLPLYLSNMTGNTSTPSLLKKGLKPTTFTTTPQPSTTNTSAQNASKSTVGPVI